jgi:hypothetical protein
MMIMFDTVWALFLVLLLHHHLPCLLIISNSKREREREERAGFPHKGLALTFSSCLLYSGYRRCLVMMMMMKTMMMMASLFNVLTSFQLTVNSFRVSLYIVTLGIMGEVTKQAT